VPLLTCSIYAVITFLSLSSLWIVTMRLS